MKTFNVGKKIVTSGSMNAKVRDEKIGGIVGGWRVAGVSANGEFLVVLYAERRMVLVNTYFEYKSIHRYTWKKAGLWNEQMVLIYYVIEDEIFRRECWMKRC